MSLSYFCISCIHTTLQPCYWKHDSQVVPKSKIGIESGTLSIQCTECERSTKSHYWVHLTSHPIITACMMILLDNMIQQTRYHDTCGYMKKTSWSCTLWWNFKYWFSWLHQYWVGGWCHTKSHATKHFTTCCSWRVFQISHPCKWQFVVWYWGNWQYTNHKI